MALVFNISGSNKDKLPSGYPSWKQYWQAQKRKQGGQITWPGTCQQAACQLEAEGAHVAKQRDIQFIGITGTLPVYIAPLCDGHNDGNTKRGHTVADRYLVPRGNYGRP